MGCWHGSTFKFLCLWILLLKDGGLDLGNINILFDIFLSPGPKPFSRKHKTKGPWADTKISFATTTNPPTLLGMEEGSHKKLKGSEWSPPKKISGGQREEGHGVVHHVQ